MSDKEQPPHPIVPLDLLTCLDNLYPNRCPALTYTDRQVWFEAGQRAVVEYLKRQYEDQNSDHKVLERK